MTRDTPVLLAVFAHPDDETFRPGGTLALLAQYGVKVHLLTLSHGEGGSCGEPPLCTPDELPGVRERELCCASAALNIEPPHLLDYPDGQLAQIDAEQIIAEIQTVVREVRPQVLLSFGPDGLSGHPDHIIVGQWTTEVFNRVEGIAALYTIAVPQSLANRLGMHQVHAVPDDSISAQRGCLSSVGDEAGCHALPCHPMELVANGRHIRRTLPVVLWAGILCTSRMPGCLC